MDLGRTEIELRRASAADRDLIERILLLASNWRAAAEDEVGVIEVSSAYTDGWGRPDDLGVLAFDGPWFAGGAYARRLGPAEGTYGYVEADLWELTMAVEPSQRNKGLGRLVLESLKAQTIERGVGGLSLSVELENTAARTLYVAANFSVVEERDTDVLMAWTSPLRRS